VCSISQLAFVVIQRVCQRSCTPPASGITTGARCRSRSARTRDHAARRSRLLANHPRRSRAVIRSCRVCDTVAPHHVLLIAGDIPSLATTRSRADHFSPNAFHEKLVFPIISLSLSLSLSSAALARAWKRRSALLVGSVNCIGRRFLSSCFAYRACSHIPGSAAGTRRENQGRAGISSHSSRRGTRARNYDLACRCLTAESSRPARVPRRGMCARAPIRHR